MTTPWRSAEDALHPRLPRKVGDAFRLARLDGVAEARPLHECAVPVVSGTFLLEFSPSFIHSRSAFFQPCSGNQRMSLSEASIKQGVRKATRRITTSSKSKGASTRRFFRQKALHWTGFSGCLAKSAVKVYGTDSGKSVPLLRKVFAMADRSRADKCSKRHVSFQMS